MPLSHAGAAEPHLDFVPTQYAKFAIAQLSALTCQRWRASPANWNWHVIVINHPYMPLVCRNYLSISFIQSITLQMIPLLCGWPSLLPILILYFFPLNNQIIPLIPLFIRSMWQRDSSFLLLQTNASISLYKKDQVVKQQGGIVQQSNPLLRSCLMALMCAQTTGYGNAVRRS